MRPFPLDAPIGHGQLVRVDPIEATTGGIVSNSGITMARLGMRVAALTYVGDDSWAPIVQGNYQSAGLDTSGLERHPTAPTSATVVFVDAEGERSFAHSQGAPKAIDVAFLRQHFDLIARSRMLLLGYYSLLPNLENDLPEILQEIRRTGCRTALDAAGTGGHMQPLDRVLPFLDIYVPSHGEAVHQTGETDPRRILRMYRACGASGLIGVKLGAEGALISPQPDQFLEISPVAAPGPVVDTTGAGDAFYAGLICGLLHGLHPAEAGRLAAAAGACCVTGRGATNAARDFAATAALAGLDSSSSFR